MPQETKSIKRKCLVVGVIFLFLGITVQPITSMNIRQIIELKSNDTIIISPVEESCNCKDVTIQDLAEVNRLLDKTEIKIKNILSTYGYIPDIKLKCNEFLTMLNTSDNDGPICKFLAVLFLPIVLIFVYFGNKESDFREMGRPVLANICLLIHNSMRAILLPIVLTAFLLGCSWIHAGPDDWT